MSKTTTTKTMLLKTTIANLRVTKEDREILVTNRSAAGSPAFLDYVLNRDYIAKQLAGLRLSQVYKLLLEIHTNYGPDLSAIKPDVIVARRKRKALRSGC